MKQALPDIPNELRLERDLIFNTDPSRPLRLHLLTPRAVQELRPALVYIFGGAFRTGSKDSGIAPLLPFAQAGYVCAAIEYRFSSEALFPAQVEDCKCAVRFLRHHATALGIDQDRIGAWGPSSGGHLATMLGVTSGIAALEEDGGWAGTSSAVQAVCNWFGPTNFLRMNAAGSSQDHDAADSPESELLGAAIQSRPDLAAAANPISYIAASSAIPPFLVMHGDADPLVPFNQSELLVAALQAVSADVTFERIAGAGHGGPAFETPAVQQRVRAFFDTHLRHAVQP